MEVAMVMEVLERAGWNGWIQLEDANHEVWKWLEDVRRLEEEVRVELEKWQPEIAEAMAVKVIYSIPFVRSCVKPDLKGQNPFCLLNIIKELSEKIECGFKDDDVKRFMNLSYPDSESAARNTRRVTTSELTVKPVRGQESEKDSLLSLLLTHEAEYIRISGPEGSGKTTVAQMVYNDERVREHFHVRKWVCVASSLDKCQERVERECDDQNFLSGKRFLLVLDDVDHMGYSFRDFLPPQGAPGSRILVTTRNQYLYLSNHYSFHDMSHLSTSDCWSILKRKALSGKPELKPKVRDIGKNFAAGCGGLPLVAKIVGDYLKSKATAQEWEEAFSDGILQLKQITRLLYPHIFWKHDLLSAELKQYFSYFAVFPKDCHIDVERVLALWEALGYNNGEVALTSFMLGEGVLTGVTASLHRYKPLTCKLNEDTNYYDVARYVAPELTMAEQLKNLSSGQSQSLECLVILSPCQLPRDLFRRLKSVKALVLSCCILEQLSDEVGSLDLLKFLDLSGNPLKLLPDTMGDLKSLESLHVHSCYLLSSLPERIGDLKKLGNLRINHTADALHYLPQTFTELTSIRSLDVFRVGGPYDNIGKLKKLNELVDIRIAVHGEVCFHDASLECKSKLENMELCFVGNGRDQELEPCASKLVPPPNLEMLLIEDYHGLILPRWILAESLINKLKRLSLRSVVNITHLPALWKLSSLEFLWLYDMPKIINIGCEFFGLPSNNFYEVCYSTDDEDEGEECYSTDDEDVCSATNWEITQERHGLRQESAASFRSLKVLKIDNLESWEKWEDIGVHYEKQIKVMPSLKELTIDGCPRLQGWPRRILRDAPLFAEELLSVQEMLFKRETNDIHVGGGNDSIVQKYIDIRKDPCIAIHGNVHFQEADLAQIRHYAQIDNLKLCFFGDGRDPEKAQCIEELVPPPHVQILKIDDYAGVRLPKWILADSIIYSLGRLIVRTSPNISSFPGLWKLSSLKFLCLFDVPSIKCLGLDFFGCSKTGQPEETGCGETISFPKLETLRMEYWPDWETWEDINVVEADENGIKVMPSLEELIISDCPKLKTKPLRILSDTPWSKKQRESKVIVREHF